MRPELSMPFNLIRHLATEALHEARKVKEAQFSNDAINWGDLKVVQVEVYETDAGTCGYRVYIEEASATAHKLRGFVYEYLREHHVVNCEVVTEW